MYIYDCNAILKTSINIRSDKYIIRDFTELTTDFKICGINPGLHTMDTKASTEFKSFITTVYINYQLVPPINHIRQQGGCWDK